MVRRLGLGKNNHLTYASLALNPRYRLLQFVNSILTLSTPGKIFSRRHVEIFLIFFPETMFWHFMQIVSISNGDNLPEMPNLVFWKNIINLSSADFAQRVVKVKG